MKRRYDVYGMGNALVDIEVEVEADFFQRLGIAKGVMSLVDEERQNRLVSELETHRFTMASGGSAANTMMTLAQFGGKGFYSCRVADDEYGRFFQEELHHAGLGYNGGRSFQEITGKCLVMVTPDADRTMNTFLGASGAFSFAQLSEEHLAQSEYLYIEGYLFAQDQGRVAIRQAIAWARQYDVKIALTFSDPFIVTAFKNEITQVLSQGVDLVFCNESEAKAFACTEDLEMATEHLKRFAKTFVITLGARGSRLFDGQELSEVAGRPVAEVVDTTGAGDTYAGAFLARLTQGASFSEAARLATLAAAEVIQKFGPRLRLAEVERVEYEAGNWEKKKQGSRNDQRVNCY